MALNSEIHLQVLGLKARVTITQHLKIRKRQPDSVCLISEFNMRLTKSSMKHTWKKKNTEVNLTKSQIQLAVSRNYILEQKQDKGQSAKYSKKKIVVFVFLALPPPS